MTRFTVIFSAWYRCIRGCSGRYDVFDVIYRCPKCDGLLEVAHDEDALAQRSGAEWRALFSQQSAVTNHASRITHHGSGVWAKHEWVLPQLAPENIVTLGEGNTPFLPAPRLAKSLGLDDLWVKQCGVSHTGSFKDLGMTVLVSVVNQMMRNGNSPVKAVACASTGDTSAALAAYGAAAGIPTIVFLPRGKVSAAQLIQPIANGALVLALDTDFDGCMRIVQEVTEDNSIYLANSMNSLRIEGQKTVGIEIVQQFDWAVPDWIIIPVGNLGNISALGKGLKLLKDLGVISKLPRLVAAQTAKANPFYLSYQAGFREKVAVQAQGTLASAIQIGDPVSYEKAVRAIQEFDGIVEQASEHELANAAARADLTGMYTCPHTGVALAALFKLVERGEIRSQDRVVVVSTAHGLKFTDMKVDYHNGELPGINVLRRNPPVELPANLDAIREVLAQRLGA